MTTPLRAILFDKDGTLFDFNATWAVWAHQFLTDLAEGDVSKAAFLGAAMGYDYAKHSFVPDSPVIAGTPEEIADCIHPFIPEIALGDLIVLMNTAAERAPQIAAVALPDLLDALRGAGYGLGVATNDAETPARAHLSGAGVIDRFDFIAGFDSGFGGKPAPGQMLAFAAHCGIDPAQGLMVGDSLHDLHAGAAAGMRCVGVLTGLASHADLAPYADAVLPDISHLPAWLQSTGLWPADAG